jgi:glycosyltransferase involved in cell wall biosynthesis
MRTLAILHLPEAAGPAQHVRPWLAALAERGPLHVVAPARGGALALYDDIASTTTLDYEALTWPSGALGFSALGARLAHETLSFLRLLRRTRPDLAVVVTTAVPSAVLAARLARVPVIVYAAEILRRRPQHSTMAGGLAVLHHRLADRLVCCSDTVASQFGPGAKVATAVPGVSADSGLGDDDGFRRLHALTNADPCVAMLGNIARGRGQDVLLRAIALLRPRFPQIQCVIAGRAVGGRRADLAYASELVRLAKELSIADVVHFVGFVENVLDLYAAADVVVNPTRFPESLGRVALEALAAGRPVVATRVGSTPNVLRHGEDALLVPPDDPDAIAGAVAELADGTELRRRLVATGRARVRAEFTEAEGTRRFLAVVDELVRPS